MPVPLRSANSRAEAKYNVTTDFPSLGLHGAAASGNIGLVEYALNRGQPVNSVLDGVLPLHAACSGGTALHEQVVKRLIDHGADVNAPRYAFIASSYVLSYLCIQVLALDAFIWLFLFIFFL
jgi:hypothetical protein